MLLQHDWPLNVRELNHALQVAATLAGGHAIDIRHLPPALVGAVPSVPIEAPQALRQQLESALMRHRGNVSEVSREIGKARMQVQRWLKRFGIDARSYRH